MLSQSQSPPAPFRARVRLPDTATTAVLIDELLGHDGPHAEYADHWLRVGGMHALVTYPADHPTAA